MRVEVGIPTKDRYVNLALLLWSLCEQSYKDWDVTIIDDSENRIVQIRRLDYDIDVTQREILAARLPEKYAVRLKKGF